MSLTPEEVKSILFQGRHSNVNIMPIVKKVLLLPNHIYCTKCEGTCIIEGTTSFEECLQCHGRGQIDTCDKQTTLSDHPFVQHITGLFNYFENSTPHNTPCCFCGKEPKTSVAYYQHRVCNSCLNLCCEALNDSSDAKLNALVESCEKTSILCRTDAEPLVNHTPRTHRPTPHKE